jgi:hypothetical protein
MLGWAYIIVIDYGSTRLVHAVGSRIFRANRCLPPGSRAAQRRETPMERFKENMALAVLCVVEMAWGDRFLASSDADGRAWAKAGAGTVGRRVGVERHRAVTFTTLRASARRTGQTAYLRAAFGRIKMAHPDLLFNSLRRNRVSMSRWMMRHWLPHPRRRRSTILVVRHTVRWYHAVGMSHAIGWSHSVWWVAARRRWPGVLSTTIALERVARRLTSTSAHRRTRMAIRMSVRVAIGTWRTASRELIQPLSSKGVCS